MNALHLIGAVFVALAVACACGWVTEDDEWGAIAWLLAAIFFITAATATLPLAVVS